MTFERVNWYLDCQPRDVQIEALQRSYYGYSSRDSLVADYTPNRFRGGKPDIGWGHFMEMRLGKTPVTLNEHMMFKNDYGVDKMLVFSPNSYKQDWCNEAEKFGVDTPFHAYESKRHKAALEFLRSTSGRGALVVNYEALKGDKTQALIRDFVDNKTLVVADESIRIKGHTSLQTKAAIVLSKEAAATRALTGLPITQGPHDLYAQMRFMRRLSGVNFFAFRNRFCVMGGYKMKAIKGPKNEEELNESLSRTSFVAKRIHWGKPTIPEHYTVRIEMSPVQTAYYQEMDREFLISMANGTEITADQVITKMQKLQQISSGFVYDAHKQAIDIMDPREVPKMKKLREMVEEEVEGKIIIPFHYQKSGDALAEVFADYNPAFIRGQQWMNKHNKDVVSEKRRFNNDRSCRIILVNITAGKYGHDLSGIQGDRCATMAFYENNYSLDDRSQVEMRNTASVQDWTNVYLDFVGSKIEQNAITALAKKMSVAEAVLGSYRAASHATS